MTKPLKAINWNDTSCKLYDDLYTLQAERFWLPQEVPVSNDKDVCN